MTPSGVRWLRREHHLLVGNGDVVHAQSATLDVPARLAVRRDQSRFHEGSEHAEAGLQTGARNFNAWKRLRERSLLEGPPRGFGGLLRRLAAVQQGGRLGGEHLLGFVELLRP